MLNDSREERLATLASAQHGAWTHAQAREIGWGKTSIHRRVVSRLWVRLLPEVYRHAASPPTWLMDVHAAVLWGGAGAVASHRTAAALWGFEGFPRVRVEISTQRSLQTSDGELLVHRRAPLPAMDVTRSWDIPVTRPARTVVDLAAVIPDEEALEAAVDGALRTGKVSVTTLWKVLERVGETRRSGVGRLRRVLDRRRGTLMRTDSPGETRLLRLLVSGGLPPPACRFEVMAGRDLVARIDLAYPKAKLAIEYDGYRYHSTRLAWAKDTSRANDLMCRGWRVLRFTSEDFRRPEAVLAAVREALGSIPRGR